MRFSDAQIAFMRARFDKNKEILRYKPSEGYLSLVIENNILHLLMDIHKAGKDES